jgi:hypothetical protein
MRCDALEECEGVADAVRYMCCQIWWRKHWVHRYDLLEESWHDTW